MPLRPPVAGLVRHEAFYEYRGETGDLPPELAMMTFWTWRAATPDLAARVESERQTIRAQYTNHLRHISPNGWSHNLIKSWRHDTPTPTKFPDFAPGQINSDSGSPSGPSAITLAISLRTQAVGASVRGINGRVFHPGIRKDYMSGNFIVGGPFLGYFLAGYDYLRTTFAANAGAPTYAGAWVVVSFRAGGTRRVPVWRAAPLVLPVDHLLVNPRFDVQRKRAPRQQSYALGT